MKYLWTPYVCMLAAFGVCSPELWMTLFKWLRLKAVHPILLVSCCHWCLGNYSSLSYHFSNNNYLRLKEKPNKRTCSSVSSRSYIVYFFLSSIPNSMFSRVLWYLVIKQSLFLMTSRTIFISQTYLIYFNRSLRPLLYLVEAGQEGQMFCRKSAQEKVQACRQALT